MTRSRRTPGPTSLKLMGRRVRIQYVEDLPGDAEDPVFGDNDPSTGTIRVSLRAHGDDTEAVHATVFHELCHLCFAWTGHAAGMTEAQHEALVVALENLAPLVRFR